MQEVLHNPLVDYYIFVALSLFPVGRVCRRAGLNLLWTAPMFIPYVGFLVTAVCLAAVKWPVLKKKEG